MKTAVARSAKPGMLQMLARAPQAFGAVADLLSALRPRLVRTAVGSPNADRHLAFSFALIALSAKITQCGGTLTRDEFLTFREVFPLDDAQSALIRDLFRLAWEDGAEAEYFARQVLFFYPEHPKLWRELMQYLCALALADGPFTAEELRLLTTIGAVLGFSRLQIGRIMGTCSEARAGEPLRVLGLKRGARMDEVRAQYRALMRRYHPDALAASVHYPEAREVAARKSARINAAYHQLARA